jgi:hypothetical protein
LFLLTEFLLAYWTILSESADPVTLLVWWQMNWKGFGRWSSNQGTVFTLDWGKPWKPVRIGCVMTETWTRTSQTQVQSITWNQITWCWLYKNDSLDTNQENLLEVCWAMWDEVTRSTETFSAMIH